MEKCICGKEFKNKNALQAHQHHHCLLCLSDAEYECEKSHMQSMLLKSNIVCKQKAEFRKSELLTRWIAEQHECEKCGKIMTEKFGSGRFCSRSCANSRERPQEVKDKISKSIRDNTKFIQTLVSPRQTKKFKSGRYKGVFCASTWELAYLIYCLDHNIQIERCTNTFDYVYLDKHHSYLPDFYLPATNTYVEIKGKNQFYNEELIKEKANSLISKKLNYIYIDDNDISKYIKYCKNTYNTTDLSSLYDHNKLITSKKHMPRTKGYRSMSKDGCRTLVNPNNIESYLANGWTFGWNMV